MNNLLKQKTGAFTDSTQNVPKKKIRHVFLDVEVEFEGLSRAKYSILCSGQDSRT